MCEEWLNPSTPPALDGDSVQVWRLDLAGAKVSTAHLSADEKQRADAMRIGIARDEFIAGRTLLRGLLATHRGCSIDQVVFSTGRAGKPFLADSPDLHFNVAHSGGQILIAVACKTVVGIDIEQNRSDFQVEEAVELAASSFHPTEIHALDVVPGSRKKDMFYAIWTRKEAVLKANGNGLSIALDSFSILPLHLDQVQLVPANVQLEGRSYGMWDLRGLAFSAGALVMSPARERVRCLEAATFYETVM